MLIYPDTDTFILRDIPGEKMFNRIYNSFMKIVLIVGILFIAQINAKSHAAVSKKHMSPTGAECVAIKHSDTLVVIGRVAEIPSAFPSNGLYNYIYIMKYRIVKVVQGTYTGKTILVGQYNPLIPRDQIKDNMDKYVGGNVKKFIVGDMHRLVLIPIDSKWQQSLVDDYFDSDMQKMYALKTDVAAK
jgi:hypothetical protein